MSSIIEIEPIPNLISLSAMPKLFGISRSTAKRMIRRKEVKIIRTKGKLYITAKSMVKWCRDREGHSMEVA